MRLIVLSATSEAQATISSTRILHCRCVSFFDPRLFRYRVTAVKATNNQHSNFLRLVSICEVLHLVLHGIGLCSDVVFFIFEDDLMVRA